MTPRSPGVAPDVALFEGLNGAQLASVTAIVDQLAAGDITRETAEQLIILAGVPKDISHKLVATVKPRPRSEEGVE